MPNNKQYFTCIGAQKSGTSWLQSYLLNFEQVFLPSIKEMHFFDSVCLPENLSGDFWEIKFRKNACKAIENKNYSSAKEYVDRLRIGSSVKKYKEYYASKSKGCHIFGDITPAYSMLDRDGFLKIKQAYKDAKIIFMMRNPVDRYWSFLRMQFNKNPTYPIKDKFYKVIKNEHVSLRSDYKRTIQELESVFSKDNILYIFYEDLFGENYDSQCGKINDFLGLTSSSVNNRGDRINASMNFELSHGMRLFAINEFSHIYKFVSTRFENVPSVWSEDIELLGA